MVCLASLPALAWRILVVLLSSDDLVALASASDEISTRIRNNRSYCLEGHLALNRFGKSSETLLFQKLKTKKKTVSDLPPLRSQCELRRLTGCSLSTILQTIGMLETVFNYERVSLCLDLDEWSPEEKSKLASLRCCREAVSVVFKSPVNEENADVLKSFRETCDFSFSSCSNNSTALAKAIREMKPLTRLTVQGHFIGPDEIILLNARHLTIQRCRLTDIDLSTLVRSVSERGLGKRRSVELFLKRKEQGVDLVKIAQAKIGVFFNEKAHYVSENGEIWSMKTEHRCDETLLTIETENLENQKLYEILCSLEAREALYALEDGSASENRWRERRIRDANRSICTLFAKGVLKYEKNIMVYESP